MIEASLLFIENTNKRHNLSPKRILDIGSKDRNLKVGARAQFPNSEYIGIDLEKGSNVDMIADAYRLNSYFEKDRFDAVLCLHLFEHVARPWIILENIKFILQTGGIMYVSIPTIGYPVHNYPGDYWRVTEQAVREVIFDGYDVLDIEHAKSTYRKYNFINGAGVKI